MPYYFFWPKRVYLVEFVYICEYIYMCKYIYIRLEKCYSCIQFYGLTKEDKIEECKK